MYDGGDVSYSEKHFSNVFAGPFSLSAPQFTHSCKCTCYLTKRAAQDAVSLLNHSFLSLEASGVFSVLFCQKHFGCTIKHSLYTPCRNQAQISKSPAHVSLICSVLPRSGIPILLHAVTLLSKINNNKGCIISA